MEKAYGGRRKIHWMEVYAGEKFTQVCGPDVWLPEETLQAVREYVVSIKGPLTTSAGGIRSPNVALRQELDLYVCLRLAEYSVIATLNLNGDHISDAGGAGGRHRHRPGGQSV